MAGYEADEAAQKCKACPVGRFKHQTGNGACLLCPAHSQALFEGSVECRYSTNYREKYVVWPGILPSYVAGIPHTTLATTHIYFSEL